MGRWFNVDPLAELMLNYSPYVYTFNNPINFVDSTGMAPEELDNEYKIYKSGGDVQKVEYISDKGGDKIDFITEINMDALMYKSSSKNYFIGVDKLESKIKTNLSFKDGKIAGTYRGIGFRHDYVYQAQSQAIEPMGFDSPFFVVVATSILAKGNISKTTSTNVQKVLNTIEDFKSQGGSVKINPLRPNQEINMTFQKGAQKLDFRIETHKLPKKLGGDGITPQRHMNVDLYPDKKVLPNSGHKILK